MTTISASSRGGDVEGLRKLGSDLTSVYFIGDLHGDVKCTKEWVHRTGLVNLTTAPWQWLGAENEALVFMGDYVDKGSFSRSVLEFIRDLEKLFPKNVCAIMGNHDLYLLLDATLDYNYHVFPMGQPVHDYSHAFVHPEEYIESGWSPPRPDDDEIMLSLHKALQYTYEREMENAIFVCSPPASRCSQDQIDLFQNIPPFNNDTKLALRAKERLLLWREEYLKGLIDSGLIDWLRRRPIIAVVGDALVVHGGLPIAVIEYLSPSVRDMDSLNFSVGELLHQKVNIPFHAFWESHASNLYQGNLIKDQIPEFTMEIILELVNYRGYFHTKRGCTEVSRVLEALKSYQLNRIVVGHTPQNRSHERCHGKLVAADSSLSRSFRAWGNIYCPINRRFRDLKLTRHAHVGDCSKAMNENCEGSTVRLYRRTGDGSADWKSEELVLSQLVDREL